METVSVHFFKVIAVLTAQNMLPPILIVQIPLDCHSDSGIKVILRLPSKLCLDLRRVDGIAAVMAGTVSYILDQAFRLVQCL